MVCLFSGVSERGICIRMGSGRWRIILPLVSDRNTTLSLLREGGCMQIGSVAKLWFSLRFLSFPSRGDNRLRLVFALSRAMNEY